MTEFDASGARQPLTDRQAEVLDFISAAVLERGFPPTIREIGNALGIRSTNGVNDHLKALERKGYLTRSGSKSRAMMVMDGAGSPAQEARPEVLSVPLLGRIAAGVPIEALESEAEHIQVDPSLLRTRGGARVFALRVEGESMIGDGILDGDIVFIRAQSTTETGEIMAVMVDGSATVKRVYRDGQALRLEPSNPALTALVIHPDEGREVTILGKVVGLYRQMS